LVEAKGKWHTAPDCRAIIRNRRFLVSTVATYASVEEAWKAGHMEPCKLCPQYLRGVTETGETVILTHSQIDIIRVIKRLYDKIGKPVTIRLVSRERNQDRTACYNMATRMVNRGFLAKRRRDGSLRARHGSLLPSEKTEMILKAFSAVPPYNSTKP
jgi:hypothetical protein